MKGWIIWLIVMSGLLLYNTLMITKWMDKVHQDKLDKAAMMYYNKVASK